MALAGKYSPAIEAYLDTLQRSGATFDRSKLQITQRNKDIPYSGRYDNRGRPIPAPTRSAPTPPSALEPSPTQSLFGKGSFSGLDAPPTKAYTKQEYDDIIANAMAVGRARNNVKSGTEYDLGGEPTWR